MTRARAVGQSIDGVPLARLLEDYRHHQVKFPLALQAVDTTGLNPEDRHALQVMEDTWTKELAIDSEKTVAASDTTSPDCSYDPTALSEGAGGLRRLADRVYACYGRAGLSIPIEGQVVGRLEVIGLLPETEDPDRRRRLFLALKPVWRAVNGDDGPRSPYRQLVRLRAAEGTTGDSLLESRTREFGIPRDTLERWLVAILERWRASTPPDELEPWDFYYVNGAIERRLSPRIPLGRLRAINDSFYRRLGAPPSALNIHYDLDPRPGKDPVAFTDFGARNRFSGGSWQPAEPWVFASYHIGGFDNLTELLHETGHAIHIAGIRVRPAFLDWPDSDTFTEALADIFADEAYEPAWQWRYLGDSVPTAESMRDRFRSVVMDVAWALLEVRMYRDPAQDPNRIWTDLTHQYLRIKPHPELSWWAMRGQLIGDPGYLMNYAIGAIITEDVRARIVQLHGAFDTADSTWYPWVTRRLYRFGLSRPSRQVLEDFLGRPVSPMALLQAMGKMGR